MNNEAVQKVMQTVELQTSTGELVTRGLIPRFITGAPPVVFFGVRCFALTGNDVDAARREANGDHASVYRECFAVSVLLNERGEYFEAGAHGLDGPMVPEAVKP